MREHFTDLCQFELIFDFYVYDFVRYLMVWNFRCLSSSLCKIMYLSRRPECNFKVEQTQNFYFRQSLFGGLFWRFTSSRKTNFWKKIGNFLGAGGRKLEQIAPKKTNVRLTFVERNEDFSPHMKIRCVLHFFTSSVCASWKATDRRKIFA